MISQEQIEEWIHEVEERPSSGAIIVRFVANRLRDLTQRNEELLVENIALRTNKRVEEYEGRIASLEYQLEMLKRQLGGDLSALPDLAAAARAEETVSVLIYLPSGRVLRVEAGVEAVQDGQQLMQLLSPIAADERPPRLLATRTEEELVFVFDSGRTLSMPVRDVPLVEDGKNLAWKNAYLVEPRSGEELATVAPLARLALAEAIVQASRRGCVKRMLKNSFESHLAKNYIGTGILARPDLNCNLVLSGKDDTLVMVSHEGFVVSLPVSKLPFTSEEALRLGVTDYIVSAFNLGRKTNLLFLTNTGKAVTRETRWLETAASAKTRGQALLNASRRDGGTRMAGAAAVDDNDWCALLLRSGAVRVARASELAASGSVSGLPADDEVVDFCAFSVRQEAA